MEAPTTEELLDDGEARTGFARGQLLMMVAKSATVRHLACHPDYRDLFVLKGGTLALYAKLQRWSRRKLSTLTHGTPRA